MLFDILVFCSIILYCAMLLYCIVAITTSIQKRPLVGYRILLFPIVYILHTALAMRDCFAHTGDRCGQQHGQDLYRDGLRGT